MNKRVAFRSHKASPWKGRSRTPEPRAEAGVSTTQQGSPSGPAGPLPWPSPSWVWTVVGEMASETWLKPPPGGQLSQGPKPLALSQLPSQTHLVPRPRAGHKKGAWLCHFLTPCPGSSQIWPWHGLWVLLAGTHSGHLSPLPAPHNPPWGARAQTQVSSSTRRPSCRHCDCGTRRRHRGSTVSVCKSAGEGRVYNAPAPARMSRSHRRQLPTPQRKDLPGGRKTKGATFCV